MSLSVMPMERLDVLDTDFCPVFLGFGDSVEFLLEIFLDADYKMYLVRNNLYLGGAGDLDIAEFVFIWSILGIHQAAGKNCGGSRRNNK